MANNIIKRTWNQNKMVNIEALQGMAFQAEDGGHTFEISGVDDSGNPVALSGTVAGIFRRPDNADIALTGTASNGIVSVTLTDACYAVTGKFGLTIFATDDGKKTAVYAAIGTVASTSGGAVAGDTPQDVVDLVNAIYAAVAAIPTCINLESGTFSDSDGTTKTANNARVRTKNPVKLSEIKYIQAPTGYLFWVFWLNDGLEKLGTSGVWIPYVSPDSAPNNAAYINIVIKDRSDDTRNLSGLVQTIQNNMKFMTADSFKLDVDSERISDIDNVHHISFEMGDLYVDGNGSGTYYASYNRMRTIHDKPIHLDKGDIISLVDPSANDILVYRKENSVYTSVTSVLINHDVFIAEAGDYEIVISYHVEATITNPATLANNVIIKRNLGSVHEGTNIENGTSVYDSELDTTITSALSKTTSRALMFGIVTDTHFDNKRASWYAQTMENMERLNNALRFNGILHLGDIINGYDDADTATYQLCYAVGRLLKIAPGHTYVTVGNHDNNNGAGSNERLSCNELYGIIDRYNEQYVNRSMASSSSLYENPTSDFYVDYANFKIRAIFFDSCYYSQGFSQDTIAWVSNAMSSAPQDYHFVLFTHMSPEAELNAGISLTNASDFKAVLATYASRIYCYIHGHTHYDYVGYPQGFAEIALCSAVPDQPSSSVPTGGVQPTRTIGTVTQDCISVIIILPAENKVELVRFGAGSDNTIPFTE